jgi:hypothetical protein
MALEFRRIYREIRREFRGGICWSPATPHLLLQEFAFVTFHVVNPKYKFIACEIVYPSTLLCLGFLIEYICLMWMGVTSEKGFVQCSIVTGVQGDWSTVLLHGLGLVHSSVVTGAGLVIVNNSLG